MFSGSLVALVTPFKNGQVDEEKIRELVEFHIENGTNGIVPCGCTGEAATLTHPEQKRIVKIVVEVVNKRLPVIAGTGSNSTQEALDLTQYAKFAGADACLMITPYYNKPTPEGQFRHYELIAKKVDIPIILYNVPSRTGICMKPETVARLSKIDNIVAIKEASGSLEQINQILSLCDITVLSGDDSLTLPMLAVGASGVISVAANIVPKEVSEMVNSFLQGDIQRARKLHFELLPIFKAIFLQTNPIPVKTSLGLMGKIKPELRMPLCEMDEDKLLKLKEVLFKAGLILKDKVASSK